jgi:splicing factor 3A subunit 1
LAPVDRISTQKLDHILMATAVSSQTLDNQLAALQNEVEHTVQVAGLNGVEATNGSSVPGLGHSKFIAGMIYPPPDIRSEQFHGTCYKHVLTNTLTIAIIDRTASFVARSANPPQFEDKIRESRREDPKFSFLNSADPYHAYYRHRIQKIEGGDEDVVMDSKPKDDLIAKPVGPPKEVVPKEPPPQEFVMEIPHIGAADL